MALQTSGQISLNDMHVEAGGSSGTSATVNDADIRDLIGKSSGSSMSFSEWYGASAGISDYFFQTEQGNAVTVRYEAVNTGKNNSVGTKYEHFRTGNGNHDQDRYSSPRSTTTDRDYIASFLQDCGIRIGGVLVNADRVQQNPFSNYSSPTTNLNTNSYYTWQTPRSDSDYPSTNSQHSLRLYVHISYPAYVNQSNANIAMNACPMKSYLYYTNQNSSNHSWRGSSSLYNYGIWHTQSSQAGYSSANACTNTYGGTGSQEIMVRVQKYTYSCQLSLHWPAPNGVNESDYYSSASTSDSDGPATNSTAGVYVRDFESFANTRFGTNDSNFSTVRFSRNAVVNSSNAPSTASGYF